MRGTNVELAHGRPHADINTDQLEGLNAYL